MPNNDVTGPRGGMLAVMGHAIYHQGRWLGGYPGEDAFYEEHIRSGFRLFEELDFECLVLSGGRTRPALEDQTGGKSEAEGMREFAVERRLCRPEDPRVVLESWSRDSFENLFFSLLEYHRQTGRWPERVGVVSWGSKALRFHLIACGLQLGGRIRFFGVGDYPTQGTLERACAAEARFTAAMVDLNHAPPAYRLVDPLLRNAVEFAAKRWTRMPRRFPADAGGNAAHLEEAKRHFVARYPALGALIDEVESVTPGDGWRGIRWPWAHGVVAR